MLLSVVNDILDIKLIEENKFVQKIELFKPQATFEFITSVFSPQATMQSTKLEFQILPSLVIAPSEREIILQPATSMELRSSREEKFPDELVGD